MSEIIKTYEEKMIKSCDTLAADYVTIRAGRANPHILDKLKVDYYGTPTPFQQVANVSVPEARMIQIQPWETFKRNREGNSYVRPWTYTNQ